MIGSVPAPGVANIALSSATGNGATLSNRPLNPPTRFDRHSLQGDLPPGWDVELYFNDGLVAFQQSRPDGKYNFADLPLVTARTNSAWCSTARSASCASSARPSCSSSR